MNIHIKDDLVFESLKQASLIYCRFGSVLYKTNDEFSDVDLHYIYTTSKKELNSFLKSHHHLQYKENGIDHIFVNFHVFLHNLLRGDSTVLFEITQSDLLKNTPLEFIYDMRHAFINYTIVRAYLGFCRRDWQYYYKQETHREQIKSLGHIWRGYYFAKSLMEGNFSLINNEFLNRFNELKTINETDFKIKKFWLEEGAKNVANLREELNSKFNNNNLDLPKYMTIENQIKLDNYITDMMHSNLWLNKQLYLNEFNLKPFYNAFENEINY
jgi:predicted nucleotidyltransferase